VCSRRFVPVFRSIVGFSELLSVGDARLRRMTDQELIKFGKEVRRIRLSGSWKKLGASGSGGKDWENANE